MPGKKGSESDPIFFKGPSDFRTWLAKNHDKVDELWIGFWKKSTGKPSLTWQQTVDEVLCFGWIDGIRKSVDADSFKQRLTPRRAKSNWSQINIRRVGALKAEGRMMPAGLAVFEKRDPTAVYTIDQPDFAGLGPNELATLKKNRKAWEFYQAQPPGYRKIVGRYVMSAKKEETREQRLKTVIAESVAGRRIGLLAPTSQGSAKK